jgi:hypothetical protein
MGKNFAVLCAWIKFDVQLNLDKPRFYFVQDSNHSRESVKALAFYLKVDL